jgi:uncharacterized protein
MKLHPNKPSALNTVTGYGEGYVEVNAIRFETPIVLMPVLAVQPWPVDRFESLSERHFEALLALRPELVLLGTGARQRFLPQALSRALFDSRIGLEIMDTRAACRTYNILMSEGRQVLAALLLS